MSALAKSFSTACLAVGLFGLALPVGRCQAEAPEGGKIPLRILYAGKPGSPREEDFVAFFKQHFRQVNTASLAGLDAKQARDADVILLDYDGDGFKAPRPKLPTDYARPTVTIGVAGGLWSSQQRLKTGYL